MLGKSLKKIAGAVSPAYGIMTGEGEMGRASRKGLFGALPRMITKDAQEAKAGSGRGAIARAAGNSNTAEPQEGAPQAGRPRMRGLLRGAAPMVGTAFSRLQANPGFQEALAKNKAMRGASTQGMKKGGSVSARADGIAKKGKTKGRMV